MNKKIAIQSIIDAASTLLDERKNSFRDVFNYFTSKEPNQIAIINHQSNCEDKFIYYKDYHSIVKRVANKLNELLKKFDKDSIVALKLKNSSIWVLLFWAILMSHHRPLLIDAKLEKENTENLLKSSNAVAIICDDEVEYSVLTLRRAHINDTTESIDFTEVWSDEVIFCSSGTTGDIKLMIYNGENMLNQLNASKDMPKENLDIIYPQSIDSLRLIALIPFHHIFAFVAIFMWYSFYNSTLVFTDTNEPIKLLNEIRSYKITHIYHVPLFYEVVMKNFINKLDEKGKIQVDKVIKYNLHKIGLKEAGLFINFANNKIKEALFGNQIRYMISGGSYLSYEASEFFNGIGYPLYNGFGMSEVGVTSVELSTNIEDRLKRSIGHPLYNVIYKLNKNNELLIKSNITHIKEIINGKIVETKLDKDGFFNSQDIATVDNDNRYYLKGRSKEVIITSNGENVYPDEIESYFSKVKGVINLAVFMSNKKIILVAHANSKQIVKELEEINKNLPMHKQVNEILISFDSLPLSSSLKVKRYIVKEKYEKGEYKSSSNSKKIDILANYDANKRKEVVKHLTAIFQEILFIKTPIEGTAHWINDLHSDSMTYITLIGEIEKEFKIKIPLEKYGKLTCLNDFAKEILDSNCK